MYHQTMKVGTGARGERSMRGQRQLALLATCGVACLQAPATAQDTRWDAMLTNSHWYVPVPNLIAFTTANRSLTIDPLAIGDQTLWAIGPASHGVFAGESQATFGSKTSSNTPTYTSMQGVVTESGQIRITFASTTGNPPISGIGQMRSIDGVPLMEMQMITGSSLLTTHWAYMAPYNPATFTPPSPTQYVPANIASPQWNWTKGTTWQISSQTLFGTSQPGTFKITDYNNGYYWGVGAAPVGNAVGNFTVLGSMTPEGNVLFSLLSGGDVFTSLTGQIVGDPTTGMMGLRAYNGNSGPVGTESVAGIMPVSNIAAGQTYFLSNVGTTVIPAFAGGTLQVDASGLANSSNFTVDGSATNRLDQRGNSALLTGVLSDAAPGAPGTLTIANSGLGGRIVLAGASTYSGPTTIDARATLVVDGSIVSPVTAAGRLRGSGTVGGAVNVVAGGTLAPGSSPGTLTVTAPVVMASGSTLALDIDGPGTASGAGNYSRLVLTGAASSFTAGGTLQPVLRDITGSASNSFTPSLGQQFAVVSAQGGVQGNFTGLVQPAGLAAGTRFDALYAPTSITLVATPASYGNLAQAGLPQTGNQASVGRALDAVRPAAGVRLTGSAASLFTPLYSLPGDAIPQTLEQLSPSLYGDVMLSARMGFYGFADQITQRLGSRRMAPVVAPTAAQNGAEATACSPACDGATNTAAGVVTGPLGTTTWLSGVGQWTQVSSGAAPGFQASLAGAMAGIDATPVPGLVVGVAVGGGSANTYSWNGASALGSALQVALYGEYTIGSFFLGGQAAYLHFDQSTTRPLGAWNSAARASLGVNGWGGQLAGGLRVPFEGWQLEPTVGFGALGLSAPGTTEQNAVGVAQQINGQSLTSLRSAVTLPVSRTLNLADDRPLRLRGLLGWTHEFADITAATQAAFVAAPGASFTATTAPIARDSVLFGLSADLGLADGVALFAGWQAAFGGSSTVQTMRAGLRLTW